MYEPGIYVTAPPCTAGAGRGEVMGYLHCPLPDAGHHGPAYGVAPGKGIIRAGLSGVIMTATPSCGGERYPGSPSQTCAFPGLSLRHAPLQGGVGVRGRMHHHLQVERGHPKNHITTLYPAFRPRSGPVTPPPPHPAGIGSADPIKKELVVSA